MVQWFQTASFTDWAAARQTIPRPPTTTSTATRWCNEAPKLQALVYDILPSTSAVFSYVIGSRKLSANEQFFVGAQTVLSLLQTTQTFVFITHHVAYDSSNQTKIV